MEENEKERENFGLVCLSIDFFFCFVGVLMQ